MHYFFEVIIPKNTAEAAPYVEMLPLTSGFITAVTVTIPKGHEGTAHLRLFYHEFQVYPLSRGQDYHGSGSEITFADRQDITAEPYELKARGWNTDTVHDHRFLVSIEVLRLTEGGGAVETTTINDLSSMIGKEVS